MTLQTIADASLESENVLNILHIEDDFSDAFILKKSLKSAGSKQQEYNIVHSPDFLSALSFLSADNTFDVILLDINLPDGDGLKNILSLKEKNSEIPIIIMTGMNNTDLAKEALEYGAQEYIVKAHGNGQIIKQVIQSSIHRKKNELELFRQAHTDQLTALPNRPYFENTASTLMKQAKRQGRTDALMFIDLDKFKEVNDTLGHEAGNIVLIEVAERLKATLRESDIIARYAGDEFVIYLDSGVHSINELLCRQIAYKISAAIEKPIDINGTDAHIGLSIGIALYPSAGQTFEELLSNADEAMYRAKKDKSQKCIIIGADKKYGEKRTPETQAATLKSSISKASNANQAYEDLQAEITKYKTVIEESEQRNIKFADTLAHDIQGPMRRIFSFIEIIEAEGENQLSGELKSHLQRVTVNRDRLQNLIRDITLYARISNETSRRAPSSLKALINNVIDELEPLVKQSKTTFIIDDLPVWHVYQDDLKQLMVNIIENAIKYKHYERDPIITIRTITTKDSCILEFIDNGKGITEDQLNKIFLPFHRLHTADEIEGSGLGLATAQNIVKKHGGKLTAHSKPGDGSSFTATLPASLTS